MTMGMKYMTARTSILIGAFLQASFCVLSAFAENFAVLYFTQGFIPGEYFYSRFIGPSNSNGNY